MLSHLLMRLSASKPNDHPLLKQHIFNPSKYNQYEVVYSIWQPIVTKYVKSIREGIDI